MSENAKDLPKSRKESVAAGVKRFFPGTPCKHGHVSPRFVSKGQCEACLKKYRLLREKTPEGRFHLAAKKRLYRKTPTGRAVSRLSSRKKREYITRATPPWSDRAAANAFDVACPSGFHLDHIIPLNGTTVCGLHILENFQYLPAGENIRKSNKLEPMSLEAAVCALPAYRTYVAPEPLGSSESES